MAVFYSQNRPNTNKNKTHKVSTPKVPSQRRSTPLEPNFHTSSAWQGAQPQKLTVSMLLPGTSSASEWRDLLQSRRQFWPTLTTRHASLVPVSAEALQRERRQMQAKHLWYNLDIRWVDLNVKTTLERCGPFSLVVLSQRRSQVTPLSGHSDQNASETFSNKLQLNKVQSSLRQTSAKTTQVRSKVKTS